MYIIIFILKFVIYTTSHLLNNNTRIRLWVSNMNIWLIRDKFKIFLNFENLLEDYIFIPISKEGINMIYGSWNSKKIRTYGNRGATLSVMHMHRAKQCSNSLLWFQWFGSLKWDCDGVWLCLVCGTFRDNATFSTLLS